MSKNERETCWNHCGHEDFVTYTSSEKRWINRFRKDAENYPGQVIVKHINEDGSMVVQYPYAWCPMPRAPRKRNLTDEQRAQLSARLEKARAAQKPTDDM